MLEILAGVLSNILYFALHVVNNSTFPRQLTAEEEAKYLRLMKEGDPIARDKLIEHNLRLVAHVTKKYYSKTNDHDDLISIGTIGLVKGISTFDVDKGTRLATYAARCIENAIITQRNKPVPVLLSMYLFRRNGTCYAT